MGGPPPHPVPSKAPSGTPSTPPPRLLPGRGPVPSVTSEPRPLSEGPVHLLPSMWPLVSLRGLPAGQRPCLILGITGLHKGPDKHFPIRGGCPRGQAHGGAQRSGQTGGCPARTPAPAKAWTTPAAPAERAAPLPPPQHQAGSHESSPREASPPLAPEVPATAQEDGILLQTGRKQLGPEL